MHTQFSFKKFLTQVTAVFMIVMLMLTAAPASQIQAAPLMAVSTPTWYIAPDGTTGPVTITPAQLTCAAGTNRLLVVAVVVEYNNTEVMTLTVTKGVALTQAVKTTGNTRTGIWIGYLNDAQITANAGSNIVITEPAGGDAWQSVNAYATCLTGVDQTTPIVAGGTTFNSSDTNTTTYNFTNVPAVNTGLMIYAAGHNGSNGITPPTGYTESDDQDGSNLRVTVGYKAVTATGNESGTIDFNDNDRYAAAVISVNPFVTPVAPTITSANNTTFTVGAAGTFTVTASGSPASTFSFTGTLPSGVTLSAAGVLSGTPASGTVGSYPITITASNGVLPNATQAFTLTVAKANTTTTISSDNPDPSLSGQNVAVAYTVTSAGNTLTPTGNVTVSDTVNNCVATVAAGTCNVALTTVGARTLTASYPGDANFNASNSAGTAHTVNAPVAPTITSANNATFTVGLANTFTVTVTGNPASTLSVSGALPTGVTFTPATGVLAGTPATGTVGTYPLVFTATNGVLPNATQNFTLTVAKANTTTTITSDTPDPSLVGQNVTVVYTVASAGNAIARTGNVTVSDGVNSCTATVAVGQCVLALTTAGARTLTATYAGDANFNGSASAGTAHTVNASYTVTTSAGTGGTLTPATAVYASGSTQNFKSTPNAGNIVADVVVDTVSVGRFNDYTLANITANHTIASSFDSGWFAPTTSSGTCTNTGNALTSNDSFTVCGTPNSAIYSNFNFNIPAGSTVDGVEVAVEGHTSGRDLDIALSDNAGSNYYAVHTSAYPVSTADQTQVLGGSTDTWGIPAPSVAAFSNASFRLQVIGAGGGGNYSLDQIQVKVHYRQPTTLVVSAATGTYGGTVNLTGTLTNTVGGAAVSGQTITFYLNGASMGTAVTNASGVATLNGVSLAGINAATYPGTFNTSGVGASYAGTAAGALPGYLSSNAANTLTVNKATLTVTANDKSREYGLVNPTLDATITGFVSGQTLATSGVTGSPACTTTAVVASPVGPYPITCAVGTLASTNYNFTFVAGTLTVTSADLLITASDDTMVYGGTVPTITPIYSGLRAGDLAPATAPTCSTTATSTSPVGSYPSTCAGAVDPNYNITYAAGNVDVTKAVLTVTANDKTREYGDPNPVLDATITGFVNGDTLADISGTASCTTTAVASSPVSGSPYPITCTAGTLTAANYSFTFVSGDLTITSADLLITASSDTMVYGGTVPTITPIYTGLKAGDAAPVTPPTCSTTATSTSPVGSYPSTCSGAVDTNYNITYAAGTVDITQATLTITASDDTMVYGGIVPVITPSYSGFVAGDNAGSLTTLPTCSTTATSASPVGSYPSSCSGAVDPNYTINYVDGTVTVTQAVLTVTANDKTREYGLANPALDAAITGFLNGDTIADISGVASCTTTAVAASPVGTYPITCAIGTLSATNYSFTFVAGTLDVTSANLLITASSDTMLYGDTVPTITPIYTGLRAGDTEPATPPTCSTTATSASPVGSYSSTCSGAVDTNYNITYAAGTVDVTQANLTITASSGSMAYGGTVPTITPIYTGLKAGDTEPATPPTCSTTATSASPAGSYPSTCAGAVDPNYNISYTPGTVTVGQVILTITASDDTMVYGGTVPTITPSYSGFVAGDNAGSLTTLPTCSTTATSASPVGSYPSSCSGAVDPNYTINYVDGTVTVTQAVLTVTANDKTREYGLANPALDATITGFLNGDTIADISGAPSCTTTAVVASPAGAYPITCALGTLSATNYSFTFVAGTLDVTSANLLITASDDTMVYGSAVPAITPIYTGLRAGDTEPATPPTCSTTATSASPVGSYPSTCAGAVDANYNITYAAGTVDVTQATATVSVTGGTFVFDGNPHPATGFAYGVGGIGDVLTPAVIFSYVGTGTTTYGPTATAPTNVGTYQVTASFAGNTDYTSASNTDTIIINPVGVTVSVTGGTFQYDATPQAATGFAYGVGGPGDVQTPAVTFSYVGTGATVYGPTAIAPTNAGTYQVTASFAGNANYSPASNFAALTITSRPIEVTAVTDTKPYDANTSSSGVPTITSGTLVGTDAFTFSQTFNNKNVGTGKTLTPLAVISVGNANNYNITYVNDTTGEITGIPLTISNVTANNRVYDGTTDATLNTGTAALAGVLGGDVVTLNSAGATGTFANKNVGPLKAVTTSGFTIGGADAGNYVLTQPTGLTANITVRPITVTAQTNTKVYDSTTASAAVPSITAGTLAAGDTANFTQTYDTANVGTSKILTPSGAVNDGNLGGNYSITFANNGTGVVTARPLTITADPKAKALGALDPALTYTLTSGSLVGSDSLSGSLTRVAGESAGTYAILQGSVTAGANYNLTYVGANLTIAVGAQNITVVTSAPANAAYNTNFNVSATASSGLPVTITTTGGACSGGGINGTATIVMISGTGTCTVHYNQAGDANFIAAPEILQNTAAQKANQTINVNTPAPANATFNTGFNVSATATSGLPVAYSSAGVCTNVGSNFTMTSGTGACTVQYNQAGDANYNAAPQVTQTTNAQKAAQTISVTTSAPASAVFNSNFIVAATASSGLPVAYSAAGSCSNAGATFTMTGSTGVCTVQFNQAGNANYNAATQVTQTVNAQKANQTITVITSAPASAAIGSNFTVAATASSGLPVAYSSAGACSNVGATFTVNSSGSCTVFYNQAGDANYNAAPQITEFANSSLAPQTINVTTPAPANAAFGSSFTVAATASSGLPVAYSSVGACTNVGATFTMTSSTGTCTVQYNQAGNATFNAAPQVTNTVNAQSANQTITVTTPAPANAAFGSSFTVAATASSGLPVTYSATGICTNVGATFTMTSGAGTCVVHYNQAGNANYNAALEVTANVNGQPANQTINVTTSAPSSALNGTSFTVAATSSSGLPVAYSATGVCTNVGATFTMTSSAGTCTVHYNQAGNANYNAATEVTEDVSPFAAPDTTITSTIPNPDNDTTPTFTFTSTDPAATFQCRVDGSAFAACNSGDTFGPLGAGSHTFEVRALDASSNPDPTPASFTWTIDTAAPNTTIDSNPPPTTNSANATFTFSSTATDLAGFECQLDGGGFASCTTPRNYTSLSAGSHTFDVRAVDTSGNVDPSPASYTWIVDLAYPTVLFNGNTTPANNATMTLGPTQFSVAFSKDVKNDGSTGAANYTPNYILVEDGANGTFDTLSCVAGLVADDVTIPMTIPNYNNNGGAGPFMVTSIINGGTRLPDGTYRLFICGTTSIEDLAGNELNNGASDTTITFTVDRNSGNNGGGNNGGGNNNGGTGNTAPSTAGLLIPVTGFAQGQITNLPAQPADKAYAATDVWMEIPKLSVKMSIVGIPQTKTGWDISWLGKNAGWLNGSAFPTWKGNSVITAHVWDAMNKPGPFVGLVNLTYGDQIKVHAFGQVYTYEVAESAVIAPSNIKAAFKHEEKSWITLITCENYQDKTETYSSRRIVRAVLVSVAKEK